MTNIAVRCETPIFKLATLPVKHRVSFEKVIDKFHPYDYSKAKDTHAKAPRPPFYTGLLLLLLDYSLKEKEKNNA